MLISIPIDFCVALDIDFDFDADLCANIFQC